MHISIYWKRRLYFIAQFFRMPLWGPYPKASWNFIAFPWKPHQSRPCPEPRTLLPGPGPAPCLDLPQPSTSPCLRLAESLHSEGEIKSKGSSNELPISMKFFPLTSHLELLHGIFKLLDAGWVVLIGRVHFNYFY